MEIWGFRVFSNWVVNLTSLSIGVAMMRSLLMIFANVYESVSVKVCWSSRSLPFVIPCRDSSVKAEKMVYTSATLNVQKKTPQSKVEFGISGHAESGKLAIFAQSEIKCSSERNHDTCSPNRSNVSYNRQVKQTTKTLLQNGKDEKMEIFNGEDE